LKNYFLHFSISFSHSSTNRVAHVLASLAVDFIYCSWWGDLPPSIDLALAADFVVSH